MRIADPTKRIEFRGFSLLPPNGPGWAAAPPIPAQPSPGYLVAFFGKDAENRGARGVHTVVASVFAWDVATRTFETASDFLHFEEAQTDNAIGVQVSPRHRVLDSKVALDDALGPK